MDPIQAVNFKECEPYSSPTDYAQATRRISQHPLMGRFLERFFPSLDPKIFQAQLAAIEDAETFQARIIAPVVQDILNKTSHGVTVSGLENLRKDQTYLFISNHRDIVCDPAILCFVLHQNGIKTPQICLGDNLLFDSLMIDLVKLNKGVTVKRDLPMRELLKWSQALSAYIHNQITTRRSSVWIAQREGRAKDGKDFTQPGVIKMLTLAGEESFLDKLEQLRVIPLAISYEFDPCDALKARELYLKEARGSYQKAGGEDALSIALGIHGEKGRIHVGIGPEISAELKNFRGLSSRKEQMDQVVNLINQEIHKAYRLWPSHFSAALEAGAMKELLPFSIQSEIESAQDYFRQRMHKQLSRLKESKSELERIQTYFLKLYSNPLAHSFPDSVSHETD